MLADSLVSYDAVPTFDEELSIGQSCQLLYCITIV